MKKIILIILTILFAVSCGNIIIEDDNTIGDPGNLNKDPGMVRIFVGNDLQARTVQPDYTNLAGYQLNIEMTTGIPHPIFSDPFYNPSLPVLEDNVWYDDSNPVKQYQFYVFGGVSYTVNWNGSFGGWGDGTKSADVGSRTFWRDTGASIISGLSSNGWNTDNHTFTPNRSGIVIVEVTNYGGGNTSGTFGVRIRSNSAVPPYGTITTQLDPINIINSNYVDVYLEDAEYNITATAYRKDGELGNSFDAVASGSVTGITVEEGAVTSNNGVIPPIILEPLGIGFGSGFINYEVLVEYPSAESYLKISNTGGIQLQMITFDETYDNDIATGSITIVPAGRYLVEIKLVKSADEIAYFHEVVEIWSGVTTDISFFVESSNYINPNFGLAYSGALLDETLTTFNGNAIGAGAGAGTSEINPKTYYIYAENLENVSANFVLTANSQFANISFVLNDGSFPGGAGYNSTQPTDFSVNNVLWVRIISEDLITTSYYKFIIPRIVNVDITPNGSLYEMTTKLTLTFDSEVFLSLSDITLIANSTGATIGSLNNMGNGIYELLINNISQSGLVSLSFAENDNFLIDQASQLEVFIYFTDQASFNNVTANGSIISSTTALNLFFNKVIPGLTEDDITLDPGVTGIIKGNLSDKGNGEYELSVSGITSSGTIDVIVSKAGYVISGSPKTIQVLYAVPVVFNSLTTDGTISAATTKIIFNFDKDIENLTADDITLIPALNKDSFNKINTGVYELEISGITEHTNLAVFVTKNGYDISPDSKNVMVYQAPNAGIIIGNTSVVLYLDNSVELQEGGSITIDAETGTYIVSIAEGEYSEIIWYLNGTVVSQGTTNTSLVLTKRVPGIFHVTVEATAAGEKNTGNHYFVIQ